MATVRVYLPTYQRKKLLERALDSLRRQSFTDWVCEVHNDDPEDDGPSQLLNRIGDHRISLNQHYRNLGGTRTFNLFYRGIKEPFYSVLEDDNWWEPQFLEILLNTAAQYPDATVFWSNMKIWKEQHDGIFEDTGSTIHQFNSGDRPVECHWGTTKNVVGAIYSNGAALHRSTQREDFQIPDVPFAAVETFRERMFHFPLVFVPQPLANFSVTLKSERSKNRADWVETGVMLAATFIRYAQYNERSMCELWAEASKKQPPLTTTFLLAGMIEPACRGFFKYAQWNNWFLLLRGIIRRPHILLRILSSRTLHPDWWSFLERHTLERFIEAGREKVLSSLQ